MKKLEVLREAAAEYVARRDRKVHPDGSFDNGGRWYPQDEERQECCNAIRSPSRAYPYSYMVHCRKMKHVANLFGVDIKELRKTVRELDGPPNREGGENYFKAVAIVDGRLLSIFDGKTEYQIGVEMRQAARQDHNGGFYLYSSLEDAENAAVPLDSALKDAQRVIIRCKADGQYCRYDTGKLSFSRITPLEVVQQPVVVEVSESVTV